MLSSQRLVKLINLKPDCMVGLMLKASICHKSKLPPQNAYRWPYETRTWDYHTFLLDPNTKKKFNENSKVIIIEGNIDSGKEDFGKRLADQLGMYYVPPIDLEGLYINRHGFDYRALNPLLPERLRICDWEMWHEHPNRHSLIHMQYHLFRLRMFRYLDGLRHLFNTGQGVIFNKSVFTEKAMVDAMHDVGYLPHGYLRSDGMQFYDYKTRHEWMRNIVLKDILKPHLLIYLKTPVETCLERVKNSDDPMLANSRAHNREFLEAIEDNFPDILARLERNGHVMELDYSKPATDDEITDVIDQIETLDFEYSDKDYRFMDWDDNRYWNWYFSWRHTLTTDRCLKFFDNMVQPWYDIAGYGDSITAPDLALRKTLYECHLRDLGWFSSLGSDYQVQGIKALLDHRSYQDKIDLSLRADFV